MLLFIRSSCKLQRKMKWCEYGLWSHILNTSFSSLLMNGPNRFEYYITISWKGLTRTNTLDFWTHLWGMNIIKCCEYSLLSHIHITLFSSLLMNGQNKLVLHNTWLQRLVTSKYSCLLCPIVSYRENEVISICVDVNMASGAIFTTLHFLPYLWTGPIG
jgi:hypothetical protein